MENKGQIDETLRQSQLTAKGQTLINAVDGLHIDVKGINQQSVSQAIDAMVQADPSMAWLKEVEARNDVDWRQVQELHDSWDESHSGLGGPAMLIVIIIVTYFTAGAASGALGSAAGATAGSSSAMSAGLAATASSGAVAAGWANAALTAMITSAASTAAVSTINNKGDVGAVFKETFSIDNLKNYIVAGGTAGLTAGFFNDWTSTTTGPGTAVTDSTSGALANTGKVVVSNPGGLSSLQGIGQFTENQLLQNSTSALLNKALGRDGSLGDALQNSLVNAFTAYGFKLVGDIGLGNNLQESGLAKIGLHALMGGLASVAAGGDFKTGALAAGVNEALIDDLASAYADLPKTERDQLLAMNSQLIGVLTTAVQDPTADIDKLQLGSSIAQSGTLYNRQLHADEEDWIKGHAKEFAEQNGISEEVAAERLGQQAVKDVDLLWRSILSDGDDSAAQAFLNGSGKTFTNELGEQQALFTAKGNQLFRPEMFGDTADPKFYKQFVQSGVNRDLSAGLLKELQDSGVAIKDGAVDLAKLAKENPLVVLSGLWEGVKDLPQSVIDGFVESGKSIGEGAAASFNEDITNKLNTIYGQDVHTAQTTLLAIRTLLAILPAGATAKAGGKLTEAAAEAISKKLDEVIERLAAQKLVKDDAKGGTALSNDVLVEARIGNGTKGQGSGNKVDQLPNQQVVGGDGKPIPVYSEKPNGPYATQEFPSTPVAHGFPDIVDNYASSATKFPLSNGSSLYQASGSYNGVAGRFEWIVDPKLGGVTHRMFVPNGTVNGIPVKP